MFKRPIYFVSACLLGTLALSAQQNDIPKDYKAPYSEVPQLNLEHDDDFDMDTRKNYRVIGDTGSLSWEKGKLVLNEGTQLQKKLNAEDWIDIEMELEFPKLTQNGQASEFKVWIDLDQSNDSFVWLRQKREEGKTRSAVFIVDTGGDWTLPEKFRTVRQPLKIAGKLPDGKWALRYRHGLWQVSTPTKRNVFCGFVGLREPLIKGYTIASISGQTRMSSLLVRQVPQPEEGFPAEIQKKIQTNLSRQNDVFRLYQSGKVKQALVIAEEIARTRKKLLGRYHSAYANSTHNLASLYKTTGDFQKAQQLMIETLAIWKKTTGEMHPNYATSLNVLGDLHKTLGQFELAEKRFDDCRNIRGVVFGKDQEIYANSLNNLATLYSTIGDLRKAESLLLQALKIREKTVGNQHPNYSLTLSNLGLLYVNMGLYEKAEPLFLESFEIDKKTISPSQPKMGTVLNNLAFFYKTVGAYDKAEPLYLQARDTIEKSLGKRHHRYAIIIKNLAGLYDLMAADEKAEQLYLESTRICEQVFGRQHRMYASSLNDMAVFYLPRDEPEKAREFLVRSLAILKNGLEKKDPIYPVVISNLAGAYHDLGNFPNAEAMLIESKEIAKAKHGERHPQYAKSLGSLADLYHSMGKHEESLKLFKECLSSLEEAIGKQHPDYALGLNNYAIACRAMGKHDLAESLLIESLRIIRSNMDRFSIVQSKKQQLRYAKEFSYNFSLFLSNALTQTGSETEVWRQAQQWKGISLLREKRDRILATRPETKQLFSELQSIRSRLAKHVRTPVTTVSWQKRTEALEQQEEEVEKKLSQLINKLNNQSVGLGGQEIEVPKNTCLVDYRRFAFSQPIDSNSDRIKSHRFRTTPHYLALVKKSDQSVNLIDLGPADKIEKAISKWRKPIENANSNNRSLDVAEQNSMKLVGAELRKLLWEPVEHQLAESELVIVSPDGALGRLPLIALPGKKPDTYLIEEKKIVYLTVPALLPKLLSRPPKYLAANSPALLIGGINYGQIEKRTNSDSLALRNGRILQTLKFGPLQGSAKEIKRLSELLSNATQLTSDLATERQFQQSLKEKTIVHIATHGFFQSPDRFMSIVHRKNQASFTALRNQTKVLNENPAMLSGLALANANSASNRPINDEGDDGILYSAEIAMMPMNNIELAVLSACETSLGTDDNPGEGLIGIQRAFQVAGAKSTIASYWKVSDVATQMLMNRFYENLIEYGKQARISRENTSPTLVRINALRDAQLWMLRGLNKTQIAQLRSRGLEDDENVPDLKTDRSAIRPNSKPNITHPRYWAAFVLSGDWR